jgi:hypothetical protein
MKKQASIITVAKLSGDNYSVDARGAFGGGWTRPTKEDELAGTITRAWQMYGNNPLGCKIIGQMPSKVQELADRLMNSEGKGESVINVRLADYEADDIRAAAAADGRSINQWARMILVKASKEAQDG